MSELRKALDEYLALRRALGFALRSVGHELASFVTFAEREGAEFVTTDLALRWARRSVRAEQTMWSARLGMVRRFARYRAAADPRTEVPPDGLLPYHRRRKPPFLYSAADVRHLIAAAAALPSPRGLRGRTFATLLALHAVTGLRTSESVGLDRADVDLERGLLFVRRTKFGKSRWVPIHPTTARALGEYARERDRVVPAPQTPAFFVTEWGGRVRKGLAHQTFRRVVRSVGLRPRADGRRPRIHDFRHGVAIATLLRWYRTGVDVERRLPLLSTFLGHTSVEDTYWYLQATPELLHWAARRVEAPRGGRPR